MYSDASTLPERTDRAHESYPLRAARQLSAVRRHRRRPRGRGPPRGLSLHDGQRHPRDAGPQPAARRHLLELRVRGHGRGRDAADGQAARRPLRDVRRPDELRGEGQALRAHARQLQLRRRRRPERLVRRALQVRRDAGERLQGAQLRHRRAHPRRARRGAEDLPRRRHQEQEQEAVHGLVPRLPGAPRRLPRPGAGVVRVQGTQLHAADLRGRGRRREPGRLRLLQLLHAPPVLQAVRARGPRQLDLDELLERAARGDDRHDRGLGQDGLLGLLGE